MIGTGGGYRQHETSPAKFLQSLGHMREDLRHKPLFIFLEYVPVRLCASQSLFLSQGWEECLEAFTQRKADRRRAGIFISHRETELFHRHLKSSDDGFPGVAKGTVKVKNYKSVVHIAAKLTQFIEISSPRHRNGNRTNAAPKKEADNYCTNILIFKNMKAKVIGLLCTAFTVFSFNGSAMAAGSHMEYPAKEINSGIGFSETPKATDDPNAAGDNIIGSYLVDHKGEKSKVKISKNADGSYTAQVFWVQNRTEKDGSVRKDAKNPDKALRNVDCDKIVIFKGLKYDSASKSWTGTTIYDPVRGINASLKASFKDSKTLSLKGTKMGFSETVFWTRLSTE